MSTFTRDHIRIIMEEHRPELGRSSYVVRRPYNSKPTHALTRDAAIEHAYLTGARLILLVDADGWHVLTASEDARKLDIVAEGQLPE